VNISGAWGTGEPARSRSEASGDRVKVDRANCRIEEQDDEILRLNTTMAQFIGE
jgi:hypothetical protein